MKSNIKNQKGAITILMAVALVGMIGVAAFAIDIGYGLVVKSELQNVADTGSLAGTRALAVAYQNVSSDYPYWGDRPTSTVESTVLSKINLITQQNEAGGIPIVVSTSDIILGKYNKTTEDVDSLTKGAMAVKVIARRDATSNGPIATTLARVFGIQSLEIAAESAATLSAVKSLPPGKQGIPVGISKYWFTSHASPCGKQDKVNHGIRLYPPQPNTGPTTETLKSCAGWHTFDDSPSNASKLRNKLDGLKNGQIQSPETEAFVTSYDFIGGTISNAFNNMKVLFETNKTDGAWKTIVPVYDSTTCANPSGLTKIVGFATVWIYSVVTNPSPSIDATVDCNVIDYGEGGGDDYGTLVGTPGMVQ